MTAFAGRCPLAAELKEAGNDGAPGLLSIIGSHRRVFVYWGWFIGDSTRCLCEQSREQPLSGDHGLPLSLWSIDPVSPDLEQRLG